MVKIIFLLNSYILLLKILNFSILDMEFDSSQPNTESVYRINSRHVLEGGLAPLPLGAAVEKESAHVSDMTRYMGSSSFVQYGVIYWEVFLPITAK